MVKPGKTVFIFFLFIALFCFILSFAVVMTDVIAQSSQAYSSQELEESSTSGGGTGVLSGKLTVPLKLIKPQLVAQQPALLVSSPVLTSIRSPDIIVTNQIVENADVSLKTSVSKILKNVEISKEEEKINIKVDEISAFTTESLEIKDKGLYLIQEGKNFEIKILPVIAYEKVKITEPQLIQEIELKLEDNKPVYAITGTQSLDVEDGVIYIEIVSKIDAETGEVMETQKLIKKNDLWVLEEEKDVLLIWDNQMVKLEDVDDKEIKKEKLFIKSVQPLVSLEKIKYPLLEKKEKFILQTKKDCVLLNKKLIAKTDNYDILAVESKDVQELLEKDCVLKIADGQNKLEFMAFSKEVLKVETEEMIRKLELKKSINDVIEAPELKEYMGEDGWEIQEGQTSPYQQFVTPAAVQIKNEVKNLNKSQIYRKAKLFVWISDSILHNQIEKWLLPSDFLKTSEMEINPIQGEVVSDCSEQANTLVSMLRASGVSAEDVRVAIGKVNFNGNVGGHAWVEIKENGKWLVLEATAGPIYNLEDNKKIDRQGVSYDYWKYHEYPVEEVWAYYNDKYFTEEAEEVASGWSNPAETALEENVNNILNSSFRRNIFQIITDWFKDLFN